MKRKVAFGFMVFLLIGMLISAQEAGPPKGSSQPGFREITPACERAIQKGIRWLLHAQNKDGSWGQDVKSPPDISTTSLCVLALCASGDTPNRGKNCRAIRAGFRYVMERALRMKGDISAFEVATLTQQKLGIKIHNYFAAIMLAEVLYMHDEPINPAWRDAVRKLLRRIDRLQLPDGRWGGGGPAGDMLPTVTAWLALRSGYFSGFNVRKASVEKTLRFVRRKFNPRTGLFGEGTGFGFRFFETPCALRILYGMGLKNLKITKRATQTMLKIGWASDFGGMGGGEDYLSALFATQSLIHEGGKAWKRWFRYIRKILLKLQNGDGSWTGSHCITGRTFCTACALLTLQTPYRLLPMIDH
jgi:hypothetical protein